MFKRAKWRWRNVPIPESYVVPLAMGIALHIFILWRLFPAPLVGHAAGWPVIATGLALAAWAVRTPGDVDLSQPAMLISTGPYAFSRNPMYLAWTIIYIGIAFIVNTAWPIAFLPAVLLATHFMIVLREERDLEQRFGEDYRRYKARVRRYL